MKGLIAGLGLLLVLGVGFFLYSSPTAPSAEMTEAEIAQIEADVGQVFDDLLNSFVTKDPEGYVALFSPTGVSLAWGGTVHKDLQSIQDRVTAWWEGAESWEGSWVEKTVEVLRPDAAMFQGTYECTVHFSNGNVRNWPGTASWTALLRQEGDVWKITFADAEAATGVLIEEG